MTLLIIDITQVLVAAVPSFFALVSVIVTILLNNRVKGYKKEVDGMKTELVEAVRGRAQSEGELKGKADQKVIEKEHQDEITTALNTPVTDNPIDVNIVDQTKPVEVTNKPKK